MKVCSGNKKKCIMINLLIVRAVVKEWLLIVNIYVIAWAVKKFIQLKKNLYAINAGMMNAKETLKLQRVSSYRICSCLGGFPKSGCFRMFTLKAVSR